MAASNFYQKNYRANGVGLVNLAALGLSENIKGVNPNNTGLYPALPYPTAPSGVDLSYGYNNAPTQLPYPTSGAPYPTGMPQSYSTPYAAPYPTVPPGLPYPSYGSGMPMPYDGVQKRGLYPSIPQLPSLPAGIVPTYGAEGRPAPDMYPNLPDIPSAPNEEVPTNEEEPSIGVAEIAFSAVKVPESENMFWLGEKARSVQPHFEEQDFNVIRDSCLENGVLFEDEVFPARNESLMFSREPDRHIEWLRPHEIVEDPQFFVEGYSRFDVQQGELGDCWLIAAAANLTHDANLFFRVVPPDQSFEENYAGVFHFCFWQYGKWVDVVIDDRLPTCRGELLYMHSTEKNEFWSALLEKAYAKLHGSYEALKGGTTCEAMEDFTGGVTEWYEMKEAPPNLFSILHKAAERGSMMGCSLHPDPNVFEAETSEGLIRGHAYSITKVCLVNISTPNRQGKIPLIRLRNPWGNEAEWSGAWSDGSPEWRFIPEEEKAEIGLNFDQDGEFWMSFQDFCNYFDSVDICNLSPDSLTEDQHMNGKTKWAMSMFEGEWTPGATAGGCRNFLETFWHNPQYVISLVDPDEEDDDGKCTIIVALMQKNRRSRRNMGMECLTIGFAIYHLTERDLQTRPQGLGFFKYRASVARSPHFINTREVCARFKLPPGHYLIVPSTFDPNEAGEFIIRVFSETQNNMQENDDSVGYGDVDNRIAPNIPQPVEPSDPQREGLRRLFNSIAGSDNEVDWMELKRILDHSLKDVMVENNNFSKDICRSMVAMLDTDQSGKLNFEEFETLLTDIAKWKAVFKLYDNNHVGTMDGFQLRSALKSAGYHLNNKILNALAHRYGSPEGKITFDDFLMCTIKVKTYIEFFKERNGDTGSATFNMDEWIERTIYS